MAQRYSVNQYLIESILNSVKIGEIAIPEIQRPFVWDSSKVRDLMDSLYQGYPVGYIIAWRSPNVRLKDGGSSEGKKVLIDGQQRITALRAAILSEPVVDQDYKKIRIRIAFHPSSERFEVHNPAIEKDKTWIKDISPIITNEIATHKVAREFLTANPDVDEDFIYDRLESLKDITKKQVGMIELGHDLDIETVTEIFIRINSKGVVLSQADFAMSKIAANEELSGSLIRKAIDYFSHLAVAPEAYENIEQNDQEFAATSYFQSMKWLRNENDNLYDPSYSDILRVALLTQFSRGRMSDLVGLLSGRNFETRTYEKEIEETSFKKLTEGVEEFINETHFKRFLMIVRSAGFVDAGLIRSQNVLNYGYALYLILKREHGNEPMIETWVRKWLVMSILTGRYSGSPESTFDFDVKMLMSEPFEQILSKIEEAELSDAFWNAALVQDLRTSSSNSPSFKVFLAAQAKLNDRGFLSKDITVRDMLIHHGDIHHIFPKNFLKKKGYTRGMYNQVANYVYLQQEVNIKVGDKAPIDYIGQVFEQIDSGKAVYGAILNTEELQKNLEMNCMPTNLDAYEFSNYEEFLEQRRRAMAKKIQRYYDSL